MSNVELSEIPSELVRLALHETIKNLTKSSNDQIKIESISKTKSNNLSGIVYRVTFTTKSQINGPSSSLILKVSPQKLTRIVCHV